MSNIFNSTFIAFEETETETVSIASRTNEFDSHRALFDASTSGLITDESLLSTWFAHCDEYGTGQVKASKLVNYIVEITYLKEAEHKETLDELHRLLDPTNDNCTVDLPTFRETLQNWLAIKHHHEKASSLVVYPPCKGFGKKRHSSPRRSPGIMETTSTSLFDCSFEVGLESQEKLISKTDDPLNFLEYQNKRLQEEKLALEKQLVALEEQNLHLLDKIPELEKILQTYQASFSRIKESEDDVEQYKLLLSAKEKELADMAEALRSCEKQEKDYLAEMESLRKLQEELDNYKIHELGLTRALKSLQNECQQLELQRQEEEDALQQERQRRRELETALEQANDFIKVLREEKEDMQLQLAYVSHNALMNPQILSPDIGVSLMNDVVKSKPVACSTPFVNLALKPRQTSIREEFKESEVNVSEVNLPFCGKLEESTFDSHLDNQFIHDLQQLLAEKKKFVTDLVHNLDLLRNEHEQTWQHLSNAQIQQTWSQIVCKAVEENIRIDAEYQASLYRLLDGASSAAGLIPSDIEEDAPDASKALGEANPVIIGDVAIPTGRTFACLRADLVPSPVEEGQTNPNPVPHETCHSIQYKNELGPGSSVGITFAVMMDTSNRNPIYDGGSKSLESSVRSRKTGLSIVQAPLMACSSSSAEGLDSLDYLDLEASPELRRRRTRKKTTLEEPAGPLSCFYESPSPIGQEKMMRISSSRSSQNKADAVQDDQVSTSSTWDITQPFPNCTDSLLIKAGVHTQSPWQPESWTEEDIESKFNLLSLSLRTDHVTLQHRLEILLRKRDVTEDNLSEEMDALQNTVRSLCASLTTKESAKLLESLEKQISLLRLLTRKISSVAEVLGAVQQEYRLSRAVDLMLMHVDNLKRRWEKDTKELEEVKIFFEECSEEQVSSLPNLPSLDSPSPGTRIRSLSLSEIVRRRTSLGSPTPSGRGASAESKDGRHRAVNVSSPKHLSFNAPLKIPSEESQFASKKKEMEKIVELAEEERERQVFAFPDTEGDRGDSNNNTSETSSTGGERGKSMTVNDNSSLDQSEGGSAERNTSKAEQRGSKVGETRKLSLNTRLQRWLNTCQMTGKEQKRKTCLASPVEQPKLSTMGRWVRRHFGNGAAQPSHLRQAARLCRWSLTGVLLLAAVASLISAFAPCFAERWLTRSPALAEGAYVPFQRLSYATWEDILGTIVKVERLGPVPI